MSSAQDWFTQGNNHAKNGDFAKALDCYNECLKLDPKNAAAQTKKASQLSYLKRHDEAIEAADKAIALNPKDNWAYNWKGMSLVKLKRYTEAMKTYDESIAIAEKANDAFNIACSLKYKASCQFEMNDYQGCLESNARSLKVSRSIQTYLDRAWYQEQKKDFEAAFKTYDEMIKIWPEDFKIYFNKGEMLQSLQRYEEALNCFLQGSSLIKQGKKSSVAFPNQIKYFSDSFEQKVKDLLELLKISKLAEDNIKTIDQSNEKAKKVVEKFKQVKQNEATVFSNLTKKQDQSDEIKELKESFASLLREVNAMKETLDEAGVTLKAYVSKSFKELNAENPKLFEYCKTFYWTLFNYFGAYRHLSTGLMQGNVDTVTNNKENFIVQGLKKFAGIGADLASGLPFIGGLICVMDKVIDGVYSQLKTKRFEDRVNAINKIIMFNQDPTAILEEDISLTIAKAAIEITRVKKDSILNPPPPSAVGTLSTGAQWLRNQIKALKDKAFGEGIDLYDSPSSVLALEDVTLLLAYLYRSHEMIIKKTDVSLSDQLKTIVTSGKSESMIDSIEVNEVEMNDKSPNKVMSPTESYSPTKTNPQSACCMLF